MPAYYNRNRSPRSSPEPWAPSHSIPESVNSSPPNHPSSSTTWGEHIGTINMSQPQNMVNAPAGSGTVVNVTVNRSSDGEHTSTVNAQHEDFHDTAGTARADHEIYFNQLLTKKRGHPLFVPGPGMQLPIEYRRNGTSIGDVGIITATGEFDFLFNIFQDAAHRINRGVVPIGFSPLSLEELECDIQRTTVYGPNTYLASSSVRKTSMNWISESAIDQRFESTAKEAAILIMPDGATTQNLLNTGGVRSKISSNARDWYTYARHTRGRDVKNGDIRVVVGIDKVRSWGIATSACNAGQTASYVFKHDPLHAYKWDCVGGSGRVGPQRSDIQDLLEGNTFPQNQCVFVRTMNFTVSGKVWNDFTSEAIQQSVPGSGRREPAPGNRGRSRGRRGGSGRGMTSAGHQPGSMQWALQCSPSVILEPVELGVDHPSAALHNCLHEKFPDATMVITEDMDWISILKDDDVVFPETDDLCARVLEAHELRNCHGIVYLLRKDDKLDFGGNLTESTTSPSLTPSNVTSNRGTSNVTPRDLSNHGLEIIPKFGLNTTAATPSPPPLRSKRFRTPRSDASRTIDRKSNPIIHVPVDRLENDPYPFEEPLQLTDSDTSDLEVAGATSDSAGLRVRSPKDDSLPDDISKDLAEIRQLRKNVKKNLKLPFRSRSDPPKTSDDDFFSGIPRSPFATDEPESATSAISSYTPPDDDDFLAFFSADSINSSAPAPAPPPPISIRTLSERLSAPKRPLLIDTRVVAAYQSVHLLHSVNIAIPSLILKRYKRPGGCLQSIHILRQFITTDQAIKRWDSLLDPSGPWDGHVVVYDEEMNPKDKDSTAWAIISVIQQLLPFNTVSYLEGGISHAGHDPYVRKSILHREEEDYPTIDDPQPYIPRLPLTPDTPRTPLISRLEAEPPTTDDMFTISTITPNFLFIGPEITTHKHVEKLKQLGVKRILNIAAECDDNNGLRLREVFEGYQKIPMWSTDRVDNVAMGLWEVCDILDDARRQTAPTYVHCKSGKSRSPIAAIAYLFHFNPWTLSEARSYVAERCKGISPKVEFISGLTKFEEQELGERRRPYQGRPRRPRVDGHARKAPVDEKRLQSIKGERKAGLGE